MESTLIASWAGMLGLSILVVIILTIAYVYVSARDRDKLKEIKETGEWEGTTYDKNHKAIAPIRERFSFDGVYMTAAVAMMICWLYFLFKGDIWVQLLAYSFLPRTVTLLTLALVHLIIWAIITLAAFGLAMVRVKFLKWYYEKRYPVHMLDRTDIPFIIKRRRAKRAARLRRLNKNPRL